VAVKIERTGIKGERGISVEGATGSQGKKGEAGRDGKSYAIEKTYERFYVLPQELFMSSKRDMPTVTLDIYKVKEGGELRRASQNVPFSADQVIKVSKDCPHGKKVLTGFCKWDLLKFKQRESWCFAEDFNVAKRGCTQCVVSVETKTMFFEKANREVVSQLTFVDLEREEQVFELTERSCKILDSAALDVSELRQCGFFCFFQKLDPIYESNTKFSCSYIPPTVFGINLESSIFAGLNLKEKLEMITIELTCTN